MCRVVLGQPPDSTSPPPPPPFPRDWRRRSADVGGLHLATSGAGQGQGWMGGDPAEIETIYAELLSDMYTETVNSVNDNSLESTPTDLPESVRSRLIHSLDRWHFEPHLLPDEELIECTLILFEALFRVEGMQEVIPLSTQQISSFIHHLRRVYRLENTYHNFEHALDVLQAVQSYLKSAGMVPPPTILFDPTRTWRPKKSFDSGSLVASLGLRELFILYVAAIGHDVGHPGFTNIFMKNAQTPLSLVFDHQSALENMHCQLLLRVMRHHGLGVLLDDPLHGGHIRKILLQSVLATDMGVHNDFMGRLQNTLNGESGSLCQRQIIICQAILKNADISNPTRPFLVSKHWANALMREWIQQANLEEELHMKPTVPSSDNPMAEANSQIFFISTFAKPLLELTEKAMPEMNMYKNHCKMNLETWKTKAAELVKQQNIASAVAHRTKSTQSLRAPPLSSSSASFSSSLSPSPPPPPPPPSSSASSTYGTSSLPPPVSPRQSDNYNTAFRMTLPRSTSGQYSPSIASSYGGQFESESLATPDSPTECESVGSSSMFSPISESSGSGSVSALSSVPPLSLASDTSSTSPSLALTGREGIRAASKLASLRQQKKLARTKKDARNSWCVATTTMAGLGGGLAALFHPPLPPLVVDGGAGDGGGGVNGVNGSGINGNAHRNITPKKMTKSASGPPLSAAGGGYIMPRLQVSP